MSLSSVEIEIIYRHLSIRARKYGLIEADREDLASDSFYKGFERIDQFVFEGNDSEKRIMALKGWFNTIMNNTFLDKIKSADYKKVDRNIEIDLTMKDNQKTPEEKSARDIAIEQFWEIFDGVLSEREKEIMLMNLEGNKYSEIAEILDLSINTIGSKINSAKSKLKDHIHLLKPIYSELKGG